MPRSAWLAPALIALGLFASLIPQVTYPSASSGEPEGEVLIAWPGWSVQQDLGPIAGTVGTFRIWISSDPSGFKAVTLNASLIDATTREVLRQALVSVSRRYIPAGHTLLFPSYVVPQGQRLMLQLGVPESQDRHVIYRLTHPDPARANVMTNGVPDSGSGPLAFAHIRTASGIRAALDGDTSGRIRLTLGLVSGLLAALAHPRLAHILGRLAAAAGRSVRRQIFRLGSKARAGAGRTAREPPSRIHRLLESPWYPWPAATVPVLHFLASNPLHFALQEAIVPLAVVLVAVTFLVVSLWIALKDWHRAAAATTAVAVIVFAYGHLQTALAGRLDDRLVFGIAVALAALVAGLIIRRGSTAFGLAPFLNLMTTTLLLFPTSTLLTEAAVAQRPRPPVRLEAVEGRTANPESSGQTQLGGRHPDIYYIILDAYARNDVLLDFYNFDNVDFVRELERRGFYVASAATSNYTNTNHSLPSILNMAYLHELGPSVPTSSDDLINLFRYNALAANLKNFGYDYIHLESGYHFTDTSPFADSSISFTPSGTLSRPGADSNSQTSEGSNGLWLSARFIRGLIRTTMLGPVFGDHFVFGGTEPYAWWSPRRATAMFEFLSGEISSERPKFVFAHVVKPHHPYSFDQYGKFLVGRRSFDDFHDAGVPSAYIGQLKYINKRVLEMVDAILQHSGPIAPIIVITSDHAQKTSGANRHSVLSAFHLPDGGNAGLYPSISVVNHFRYILDYYFGFELGLLEDHILWYPSETVDFRR